MSEGREPVENTGFMGQIVFSWFIVGRSAGIRTPGLLVPKIGLKMYGTLSGAFGDVCYECDCFPNLSAPMSPSAPGVVWVSVWVSRSKYSSKRFAMRKLQFNAML